MSHYDDLDNDLLALRQSATPGISKADATLFWSAMRKLAAEGAPAPDADLAQHQVDVTTGEEASPVEAAAHTQMGAPDETGHLEGEFAVPIEQVVQTLAQIVSNSMRQHTAYAFYGEMMRDVGRGELAELFEEQGEGELKEMHYFLRRMGVLHPGGVPIPVAPTPDPSPDVTTALKYLIAGEQQAIVLFKTLHSMLGNNPMKYTIEQTMTDAQEHLDKLWQYMPATEAPAQGKAAKKLASVITQMKLAARTGTESMLGAALGDGVPQPTTSKTKLSDNGPKPGPGAIPVGAPGTEPLSAVLSREAMLQQAQLMNENQDLRSRVDQAGQQALMAQQQLESIGAENENLQAQAMQASDQAQMATEQAQLSSEQAAAQADAKMRLAIRVNQLRQSLADIVSADPVSEEGVAFGEAAGPGSVATSSQQNQMAQQAAAMDPTGGMGGAPSQGAAQQQQEAANAQQDAQKQTAQAQEKTKEDASKGGDKGKGGTHVSVKTSGMPPVHMLEQKAVHAASDSRHVFKKMLAAGHDPHKALAEHRDRMATVMGHAAADLADKGKELTHRLRTSHQVGAAGTAGGVAAGFAAGRASKDTKKTSSLADVAKKPFVSAGHAMGEGIAQHIERAGGDAVKGGLKALRERVGEYKKNPKVVGAALAGGGLLVAHKAHEAQKQHERDNVQKKILAAVSARH